MTQSQLESQERLRMILRRMGVSNFEVLRKALAIVDKATKESYSR